MIGIFIIQTLIVIAIDMSVHPDTSTFLSVWQHSINQAIAAIEWPEQPSSLYRPIQYTLEHGGKRLRPMLCLLGADVMGGSVADALPAALCVELFHNFTLLHDDIMDNAPLRRGRPTVSAAHGANAAILSGDALMIAAYARLQAYEGVQLAQLFSVFNRMADEVCAGQQFDMDMEDRNCVDTTEYMRMIRLKTSVLLGASLQMGAITAGASRAAQKCLYDFGVLAGLAFQIQDDVLDVYGDPDAFGKKAGGDIDAGKNSYLRVRAMEVADDTSREAIMKWYSSPPGPLRIREVKHLFDHLGVHQLATDHMNALLMEAKETLFNTPDAKPASIDRLWNFAQTLVKRTN
jgi:geranylgeranyl diphosphate synthase type II